MITIRAANENDLDSIVELWKVFMEIHDKAVLEKDLSVEPYLVLRDDADDRFKAYINMLISSEDGSIFLSEFNSVMAGYCLVRLIDNNPLFEVEKLGYINDLFVKEEFRGQGISSELIDRALEWFREKKINHISLKAYTGNRDATLIYKHWGFIDYQVEMRKTI